MEGMQSSSSASALMAQRRWILENNIADTLAMDNSFKYDREEQQMIRNVKPWEKDPHYFKVGIIVFFLWKVDRSKNLFEGGENLITRPAQDGDARA